MYKRQVQATDYDGGTGSAEKTQETYLKTFLEDLDFAELDTWTKEELFPEQREKFSFSVMVQELLADGIGAVSYTHLYIDSYTYYLFHANPPFLRQTYYHSDLFVTRMYLIQPV